MLLSALSIAAPADRVPTPRPEPCLEITGDPEEGEVVQAEGLAYGDVRLALNGVIQSALYCPRPEGFDEVHLTFELLVGCDGVVDRVDVLDAGGAPEDYGACIGSVIAKADFPAHDMPDGMPVTYPVDVAW